MKRVVRLGDITCENSVEGNALQPFEGILVSADLGTMSIGLNLKTYNLADSSKNITNKFHRSRDDHRFPTIPLSDGSLKSLYMLSQRTECDLRYP